MADNNDTEKTTTQQAPAVNIEERAIIRQIISEEIAAGLVPLVNRVDALAGDLDEAKKSLSRAHEKVKTLDELYRTANNTYIDVVASNNKVIGALAELQRTLDKWAATSSDNSRHIVELKEDLDTVRRELYGDPKQLHDRSIMGELSKIPALIGSAIKTEVHPLITRIDKLQTTVDENTKWINARRAIEAAAQKYIGGMVKSTGVRWAIGVGASVVLAYLGYSAATETNLLVELVRILGGG